MRQEYLSGDCISEQAKAAHRIRQTAHYHQHCVFLSAYAPPGAAAKTPNRRKTMENALGIWGPQAIMMAVTASFTVLGMIMLLAAVFMKRRWKPSYSVEFAFIALMLGLVWYADSLSFSTYSAYQENLNAEEKMVSGNAVEGEAAFDRVLTVVAFQWGFAFINEEEEISRNAAIVKPGEKVLFKIISNDVIHGFNIPVAQITAEIDPDDKREVWIRAPDKPGRYLIQCVNYCGVGHSQMKAWLVVTADDIATSTIQTTGGNT
jgi:cytochrome c oxidase subunit II